MKKRILTILAILLAIALLCICTLPVKTVDTLALPGGQIDFEGNSDLRGNHQAAFDLAQLPVPGGHHGPGGHLRQPGYPDVHP